MSSLVLREEMLTEEWKTGISGLTGHLDVGEVTHDRAPGIPAASNTG